MTGTRAGEVREQLALADARLAECKRRIAAQELRLEQLSSGRAELARQAAADLAALQDELRDLTYQRELIAGHLARLAGAMKGG